jgi:SAM-dependent methyltransferase
VSLLARYFKSLYEDAMRRAYDTAYLHITGSLNDHVRVLDCGAASGHSFDVLVRTRGIGPAQYRGVEWDAESAARGRSRGLDIVQADLNRGIPHEAGAFGCVFALSVLEHLLNPCRFLKDCHRVLEPGGRLVLLTPNISTYFTALLILLGKMPSSGPHPDSNELLKGEEIFKVSSAELAHDAEDDTPVHRHLVVFSYRVLRDYLRTVGFSQVHGRGFGLYPFPVFAQPLLERADPYHCHQMVFVATK